MSVLTRIADALEAKPLLQPLGRISALSSARVEISGLEEHAGVGDRILLQRGPHRVMADVVALRGTTLFALPEDEIDLFRIGDIALAQGPRRIRPCESWLDRLVDADGEPLDGMPLEKGRARSLNAPAPSPASRRSLGAPLDTGLATLDTILPVVSGQRVGIFAPAGVGKSTLIQHLAKSVEVDVVVVALVGERGREVRDVCDAILGHDANSRAVVVAATSDRPAAQRRRCVATAVTIAEYFRDTGRQVLLLVDSVTRLAEAHREVALQSGESPALRGHPPSLVPLLAGLLERTGPGAGRGGDITAIFSVLVAGDDENEPVADTLRGQLDGHIILSRGIAERGRFPAIDVLRSVSRALPEAASQSENDLIQGARQVLSLHEKSHLMVRSGLYQGGRDLDLDRALKVFPALDRFLGAETSAGRDAAFDDLRALLDDASEHQAVGKV